MIDPDTRERMEAAAKARKAALTATGEAPTAVDHPPHYHPGDHEAIDVIEAWGLGFNLGNVIKYIARAEHKGNRATDLRKALWYLEREIGRCEPEVVKTVQRTSEPLNACVQCGRKARLHRRPVGLKLWCSTSCRHLWFVCRALPVRPYAQMDDTDCEVCGCSTGGLYRAAPVCDRCFKNHVKGEMGCK